MLTSAQLPALKAAIDADPLLSAEPKNSDGEFNIAAAFNLAATPNYFVWKTWATINELLGAGFDWTRVDNLTVGKARIWEFMTALGAINPSQSNVRAGVNACFSVAAADAPCRQAIFNGSQRLALRGEKLYATGSGATSNDQGVGPSTMGFEGNISAADVNAARNLP